MNLEKYLTFPMFSYDNNNKIISQRYNTWDFSTYMLPIEGKGFFDFYYTQLIANELYQKNRKHILFDFWYNVQIMS